MGRSGSRGIYLGGGLIAALGLATLLAACGGPASANSGNSGSTASASATATCPPTGSFKTATGTLSAVSGSAITVTDTKGAQTVFNLDSSTRVTKMVTEPASALTAGTSVQVITDTNVTTAQRITILGQGAGQGRGGFPGFGGGRTGTPAAGANRNCFTRGGQGAGAAGGPASGFQGLRGTVASASSTQLVLDDTQGQTFSMAITPSTQILTSQAGKASDLAVGDKATVAGTASGSSYTARTITVQQAASQ